MSVDLEIVDLHVSTTEGKQILKGVNLQVSKGEVHALMGPNGSGKSTLASVIMGHPGYVVDSGDIRLNGESILELEPDVRAHKGLFLAFQYPSAVPGVSMANFLRTALNAVRASRSNGHALPPISPRDFRTLMQQKMATLKMDSTFVNRYLNEGFSGGEKKRAEILQMAILEPQIAVMDETDSGLDIDALRTVADGVNTLLGPHMGALVITHYQRLLNYIKPHFVHVLLDGRVVLSGGPEVAHQLEAAGYEQLEKEYGGNPGGGTA
jgi:Fe-S cluster assembly ATP-binding protein